jgi:hypothetical protein
MSLGHVHGVVHLPRSLHRALPLYSMVIASPC